MGKHRKSVLLDSTPKLVDEASLLDTAMDGLNKRFKVATEKFEKITNPTERILKKVDKILKILVEGRWR